MEAARGAQSIMVFEFKDFESKAEKAEAHVRQDVGTLRTGRATAQLLDPVIVEAYGSMLRISEVATVQAPDPTLLVVSPWDKSLMENIEKAIAKAGLNLNPVVNGDIIRIAVPPLTEEKRREMVKMLQKKIEAGRVMLRNIRTSAKQEIELQKNEGGVSEDDIKRDLQELDKRVQSYIDSLDELENSKEKELMTV